MLSNGFVIHKSYTNYEALKSFRKSIVLVSLQECPFVKNQPRPFITLSDIEHYTPNEKLIS